MDPHAAARPGVAHGVLGVGDALDELDGSAHARAVPVLAQAPDCHVGRELGGLGVLVELGLLDLVFLVVVVVDIVVFVVGGLVGGAVGASVGRSVVVVVVLFVVVVVDVVVFVVDVSLP